MELPTEGIYCIAKASSNTRVEATAHLPYPIDLSKHKAEIAIKYIAITPTWKYAKELYIDVNTVGGEDPSTRIVFDHIIGTDVDRLVQNLRKQLETYNKESSDARVRIVWHKTKAYSVFRLTEATTVLFSESLAQLCGVTPNQVYIGPGDIGIKLPDDGGLTSTSDIYYLKSEAITGNFMVDSHQDCIVEVLHIPRKETTDFRPVMTYVATENIILQRLRFSLFNSENQPVFSDHSDLYVICHLRPRQ